VDAYAEAIARLVADPALHKAQGAAGHAKAQAYQWDAINQKVIDTYLEVMDRRAKA
jgi:glycosyltransferase involved in cell wall biosynthesis